MSSFGATGAGTRQILIFQLLHQLLMVVDRQVNRLQDGGKQEPESNVLLASVENMQYAITINVLHMVFSVSGTVQKIAVFEKNAGLRALIQYPEIQNAIIAMVALEERCIYEGGFCKLHLTYSCHTDLNVKINNDRGRDYTGGNTAMLSNQPSILSPLQILMLGGMPRYNNVPYLPSMQLWNLSLLQGGIQELVQCPHAESNVYASWGCPSRCRSSDDSLTWSREPTGLRLPGMRHQVVPLPGQGIQQGAMPLGMSPETMQMPGQGSQQRTHVSRYGYIDDAVPWSSKSTVRYAILNALQPLNNLRSVTVFYYLTTVARSSRASILFLLVLLL